MVTKNRRRTGTFYTPKIWVDEAHKMIVEQFGDNWKDEYVVWDCACGLANLTRNYKFKELYLSTIDESDINTIKDCKYNKDATIFKYDFLASMGLENLPENLKEAFRTGKKILFLINPPYGTSKHYDIDKGTSKTGIADTAINVCMNKNVLGASRQQLYAQFLYKIGVLSQKYKNVGIGCFAPPLFMSGQSFNKFRDNFYNNFLFCAGMIFKASNFSDVKGLWGIAFSTWKSRNNNGQE